MQTRLLLGSCMRRVQNMGSAAHLLSAPGLMLATISRMLMPPVAKPSSAVHGLLLLLCSLMGHA